VRAKEEEKEEKNFFRIFLLCRSVSVSVLGWNGWDNRGPNEVLDLEVNRSHKLRRRRVQEDRVAAHVEATKRGFGVWQHRGIVAGKGCQGESNSQHLKVHDGRNNGAPTAIGGGKSHNSRVRKKKRKKIWEGKQEDLEDEDEDEGYLNIRHKGECIGA